jgi:wyosine [tRNA(Phe)-imidazoG37] synthetase (radical SAM superfamily)
MVVRGPGWDGSSDRSLRAWLPLVAVAEPETVQLTTLTRPPANARVENVSRERLLEMAAATREALPRTAVRIF